MYISKSIITALLLAGGARAGSTQDNLKNQKRFAEEEVVDPDCAAKENGAELFPEYDPANIALKVESVIDTETCTYDVTVSYEPDTSIPFIDSPRGGGISSLGLQCPREALLVLPDLVLRRCSS